MNVHTAAKRHVRAWIIPLARGLDRLSGSRLTPNMVTLAGLAAHLPIAYLLYYGHWLIGGLLVVFFGLFDTLDGALAKVQHVASERGMFLDASTDRLKELLIYVGLSGWFIAHGVAWAALAALGACGLSLIVSYVKAKGEAAIASRQTNPSDKSPKLSHQQLNQLFGDGIGGYEVRIILLAAGCLFTVPAYAVTVVLVLSFGTVARRMILITRALS